uniref:Phosphatidate cytidylyltransferase n=1 Tax=Trypanosoma vivax (strain Y486) TaxID=1055687 RepID=G0TXH2_TRYVY|nr:putative CDP-diacylglycerol synthetase [Trypanosoma vivax Y486]
MKILHYFICLLLHIYFKPYSQRRPHNHDSKIKGNQKRKQDVGSAMGGNGSNRPILTPLKGNLAPKVPGPNNDASGFTATRTTDTLGKPVNKHKYTNVINRIVFSLVMAFAFIGIISVGVKATIPFIIIILFMMFHEISRINQRERKERQLPSVFILKMWFLFITLFLMTGSSVQKPMVASYPWTQWFYRNFGMLAFLLYLIGVVGFVLSLRKGMYLYQFIQFTWIVMILGLVVFQGYFQMLNMMRGMVWFILPVGCVINNDIWAYVFGKLFGRTRLLALSPNKTLEGFLGSFLFTMIWSFWFAGFIGYFPEMHCPKVDFHSPMRCKKDSLFLQREVELPSFLRTVTCQLITTIRCSKAQQHALVLGAFASLLAPFGGFFASGLKRAFKLKDFGDLIPGHGGITDRMDCQNVMGFFTYVYLSSYVFYEPACPLYHELNNCVLQLDEGQRRMLLRILNESLIGGPARA